MSRLTRDGTAEPVSRDQILRREQRGQGNIHFPYSADHVQDWQPYPVDPYSCYMCDHTYIKERIFHDYIINGNYVISSIVSHCVLMILHIITIPIMVTRICVCTRAIFLLNS